VVELKDRVRFHDEAHDEESVSPAKQTLSEISEAKLKALIGIYVDASHFVCEASRFEIGNNYFRENEDVSR
jgi:hypothetical protein